MFRVDLQSRVNIFFVENHSVQFSVQLLLKEGADIRAVNLEDQTPLHLAAKNGKEKYVSVQ